MRKVAHILSIYDRAFEKGALSLPSNSRIVGVLNELLRDEMTVVNQYMVQHALCGDRGYDILSKALKMQAITEMKHAEALMERIIFLEGIPEVGQLGEVKVGSSVPEMLQNNFSSEQDGIQKYNSAISDCISLRDNGTRQLLERHLADEERHHDETQTRLDQIKKLGLPLFLAEMTTG